MLETDVRVIEEGGVPCTAAKQLIQRAIEAELAELLEQPALDSGMSRAAV